MDGLTVKQDKFAREYVKDGNGTRAALAAGYGKGTNEPAAAVRASEAVRVRKVAKAIARLRARHAEKLDISKEKLVNDAAHIAEQAAANGDYSPAIKATELIMRAQGYIVDKSVNLNLDLTGSHLEALQDLIRGKGQSSVEAAPAGTTEPHPGDAAQPVDVEVIPDR